MHPRRVRIVVGEEARAPAGEALQPALAHALDPKERVRWEQAPTWKLLVVRVPRRERAPQLALDTIPVGLVVAEDEIVLASASESDVLGELRAKCADTMTPLEALTALLHAVARSFADTVDLIEVAIDEVEAVLVRSLRNTEVLELLRYQKALVHHTSALRALVTILDRLPAALALSRAEARVLGDVGVELRQALEVADIERDTLGDTMDAFASIISNNLNDVMRAMTAVAVILTPPVAIASLWGMNVALPLANDPDAFWKLVALSALSSVAAALGLRLRGWL